MKPLVNIAFQGGSHGHFLKYILDRYSSLTPNITQLPFEQDGTSHKELQYSGKFEIYHPIPFDKPIWKDPDLPHVLITIDKEDVVFIERWVNIRANGFNLDTNQDTIKFSEEYFNVVPMKQKLQDLYGVNSLDVPRCVLRDFYKQSFLNLDANGFIHRDKMCRQQKPKNTFMFPVSAFWDEEYFYKKIKELNERFSLGIREIDQDVYDSFIKKLPWIKTKNRVFEIIDAIKTKKDLDISQIDTVEQAYIGAWIEKHNDFITIPYSNSFFQNTKEIIQWLQHYPQHYKAMNPNLPSFNGIPNPFHLAKLKK